MRKYVSCVIALSIGLLISCDDIIEDDITNDLVTTVAPQDMAQIEGNSVQFRWDPIDGADEYRIQINNQASNSIILDSLVNTSVFDYTMNPGSYEWRVRGENFAYQTAYSFSAAFSVVASADLTDQTVTLSSPNNGVFLNDTGITFSWEAISTATFYKIRIFRIDGATETEIFNNNNENIIGTSITIGNSVITEDALYRWEISAGNGSSATTYFPRTFSVDTQDPPKPTLTEPISGGTISTGEEVSFKWIFTDTGTIQSGVTYTLQIATDQDFNDVIQSASEDVEEYSFTFNTADTYFWRVRGVDDAGNVGDYSDSSQIIVN